MKKITEIIAIVSMNMFVLLGGWLSVGLYKGQYYTIYDFPEDNWYGLVIKAVYIAAIFLLLFVIVPQTAKSRDMAESTALTFLVSMGFVGTQVAGLIDMGILPTLGFTILTIFLFLATYALYMTYRDVHKPVKAQPAREQKDVPNLATALEQAMEYEASHKEFAELKDTFHKYIEEARQEMKDKATDYRLVSVATLATVLLYKLPVLFFGEERVSLVALTEPYVRTGTILTLISFILSYTVLLNKKSTWWSVIIVMLVVGTSIYMLYVLGTATGFERVTWLMAVFAAFFIKSIHDIINNL